MKTIIAALLKAFRFLFEVIVLTLFCMMVFAMFALQVYQGILRQKCVLDIDYAVNVDDYTYSQHIKNSGIYFLHFFVCKTRLVGFSSMSAYATNYSKVGPHSLCCKYM